MISLIACLGAVWILKYGTILNFIRTPLCNLHPKIKELFSCALCLGFWVGCLHSLILYFSGSWPTLTWFYYPFASAAFCWFFDCVINAIQTYELLGDRKLDQKNH